MKGRESSLIFISGEVLESKDQTVETTFNGLIDLSTEENSKKLNIYNVESSKVPVN